MIIFFLLLWPIGSFFTHFPDSHQLEVFMLLICICLNLGLSCFLVDSLDFLTQSSLRCEFWKNIIMQIIKTATKILHLQTPCLSLKRLETGQSGNTWRRDGQQNNTNSATERIDSTGSADRHGAVWQASTTERMTDTTMRTRTRDRAQPWLRMQPCKNFGQNIELLEFDPYDPGWNWYHCS